MDGGRSGGEQREEERNIGEGEGDGWRQGEMESEAEVFKCLIRNGSNLSSIHCRANIWQLVTFHNSPPPPTAIPSLPPSLCSCPTPFYYIVSLCISIGDVVAQSRVGETSTGEMR